MRRGDWTAHLFKLGPGEAQVCEILEARLQVLQRVLDNAWVAQEQHAQLPVLQADLPSMRDSSGSTSLSTDPLPWDTTFLGGGPSNPIFTKWYSLLSEKQI